MEYRTLGDTGLTVSAIGFGCWDMGNPGYGSTEDDEVIAAVDRAIELGVTLFDTAPNYGFGGSELVLGRALQGRRDEIVLVTKVCTTWDLVTHTTKIDGRYSTIKRMCEESLTRLQTDHVDLLLVHWPDADTPIAETMRALEELKAEGKTRHGVLFGQRLFGPNLGPNLDVVDKLGGVAADLNTTLPRLALSWVLRDPAVSVALSGCRSPREIEENVEALDATIPDDALAEIDAIMAGAAGQTDVVPGRHHQPPTS